MLFHAWWDGYNKTPNVGGNVEKLELPYIAGGDTKLSTYLGKCLVVPQKVKPRVIYNTAIPLTDTHGKWKLIWPNNLYKMFIEDLNVHGNG